jgi:lactoylglutathione lyase
MRIDHLAIWTNNLERLKEFYIKYFKATANTKYINPKKKFESYFLSFDNGARIEIMRRPGIPESLNDSVAEFTGYIHLAISVGSKTLVDSLTETLRKDGYKVVSEPRTTGDGCYESVILDPDGNRVEIVE